MAKAERAKDGLPTGGNLPVREIFNSIILLQRVLVRIHANAGEGDLARLQLGALGVTSVIDDVPVSELGRRLKISKSQASVLVRGLVGEGLLGRGTDPVDGRVQAVSITAKGRSVLARNVERLQADMEARVAPLSPADRSKLVESILAIAEILGKLPEENE